MRKASFHLIMQLISLTNFPETRFEEAPPLAGSFYCIVVAPLTYQPSATVQQHRNSFRIEMQGHEHLKSNNIHLDKYQSRDLAK